MLEMQNRRREKNEIRENLLMNESIHDTQWGASGKGKDSKRGVLFDRTSSVSQCRVSN